MGKLEQSVREDADLTQVREAAESQLATSFVNIGGRTSQEPLEGVILEACVQQGKRYLVFLTDDIPHEDCLHIHLLDSNLSRQDSVTLGAAYTTGNFRHLNLEERGGLTFEFFGDNAWRVSVLSEQRLRIPYLSGSRGVSWGKGLFHWLDLRSVRDSISEE